MKTTEEKLILKKTIVIDTCDSCPFLVRDDNFHEERWGKEWCEKLDRELKTLEIPSDCPLPSA